LFAIFGLWRFLWLVIECFICNFDGWRNSTIVRQSDFVCNYCVDFAFRFSWYCLHHMLNKSSLIWWYLLLQYQYFLGWQWVVSLKTSSHHLLPHLLLQCVWLYFLHVYWATLTTRKLIEGAGMDAEWWAMQTIVICLLNVRNSSFYGKRKIKYTKLSNLRHYHISIGDAYFTCWFTFYDAMSHSNWLTMIFSFCCVQSMDSSGRLYYLHPPLLHCRCVTWYGIVNL